MTGIPKMIAFFIAIAFIISFFKDITIVAYAKDDFRSSVQASAQTVALKHMDWGALRKGKPYLMQEGIEETVQNVMKQNLNLKVDSMNVKIGSQSVPAYIALTINSKYDSSTLSLLHLSNTLVEVPVRVVEIIEAKDTEKND